MTESASPERSEAESPEQRKKRYKKSLNLPRTPFPMRANLAQNEPQSSKRWLKEDLYQKVLAARAGGEPFIFHDGPPYANGSIHVGHLLNKVLKDMVVRSQALAGRYCPYIPGWDCHGLPIEHKVLSGLVESGKAEKLESLPEDQKRMAIRRECSRYAAKYHKLQAEQMKRLLTLADYDEPYLTMAPAYEEGVIEVLADLVDQGLVYRALKPVHWSIANETALAEAELEYFDREDPSVTVRFDAEDPAAVAAAFGVEDASGVAFLIWTTTPWTLPANRLIAVHERFSYALVEIGGQLAVLAEELVERLAQQVGEEAAIVAKVRGAELVGLTYGHPFLEGGGRIVAADYVTLEDGTGMVHTAPGHGQEDYMTGLAEGIDPYSPVRGDGTYDDSVPEWLRGLSVWDANPLIVERLRSSGHLTAHAAYEHSYPHDWRSKTPVIFRCTEQWFVGVDRPTAKQGRSLREMALDAAAGGVDFYPAWGAKRLTGMLESRPDWCISRQRAWGLPIPAFRTPTGEVFMTSASVRAVGSVFATEGSDAWFQSSPAELLAGYDPASDPEAPEGLEIEGLAKMYDILDVWFESGSSWNSAMRRRGDHYPTDLYLEGSDQHRGWFQSSLLNSLGSTGVPAFGALLTHGFIVDKDGRKMSKSVGNTLDVDDLLKDFGADVCRWWVSSLAFENDIKVDLSYFEVAGESYRKVRNTLRFLLSNLSDFEPDHALDLASLDPASLDAWAVAEGEALREKVIAHYLSYEFRQAHLALYDFCNETLSAFYLDAVKDRLYCDRPDSARRRATQSVLAHLSELLASLLAPILPHTADEAFRARRGDDVSVHIAPPPGAVTVETHGGWPGVMEAREAADRALEAAKADGVENPLDAGLTLPDPGGNLEPFAADLPDVLGVSRVALAPDASEILVSDLRDEPRCERSWRRDGTVRMRSDGGMLSDRDAQAVGLSEGDS